MRGRQAGTGDKSFLHLDLQAAEREWAWHGRWKLLSLSTVHTSSNKTGLPDPFQIVQLTGGQTFKHGSVGKFSLHPHGAELNVALNFKYFDE